ncbi:IS3 family transposase [Nocardioides sp. Kera G14]|uniref:IS3 family transposase n=1 Tax=Nocardioides sp. Kera G14 TaxID=2884264 RepID=UPI0022392C7A|nr:IS3 family transposase [Nocardioides sp. Kera G14]
MLIKKYKVSERRACRLVGQHRSSNRYEPRPTDLEAKLVERMHALSLEHPKWGYRMIHGLLVAEGWPVNKKRIERLWRREGLQVPPRKVKASGQKAVGEDANSTRRLPARYRNHVWSYDFIKRRTSDGRPLRVLNVIDEFTRVGLGSHVARGIGAKGVREHLEKLFEIHGKPTLIRADNGREFIADSLLDWLGEQQVRGVFIAKASPWQNGINERFNGTMERELFGHEVYHSILEVQFVVDAWTEKYNTMRVHRSLKGQTPAAYAKMLQEATPYNLGGGSR